MIKMQFLQQVSLVTFTVCGILFSVAMSQIISFDLTKIVNEEIYQDMVSSHKQVRKNLIWQLFFTAIAFLAVEIAFGKINTIQNECHEVIKLLNLGIIFLNAYLICSFFNFLYSFQDLSDKKLKLDETIRKEMLDK